MKAKAVSALRDKRGLPAGVRQAVPQVVGLTPQTINEWKADTMKTYILKPFPAVEPQKPQPPLLDEPVIQATAGTILGRPAPVASGPVLFVGLDLHNDSIAVSLAPRDSIAVRRYGTLGGEHDDAMPVPVLYT